MGEKRSIDRKSVRHNTWAVVVFLALGTTAIASVHPYDASTAQYSDVKDFLAQLIAQHPSTAKLFTLGDSDSGDTIQGVAIGNGPVKNLVVSTHHGNEYGSTEVAKAFAQSVAENPVAGQTLFVIPVLNIGGYNIKDRYELGHDPNRDYPGPCGTEGPHLLKSTAALAKFVDQQGIVASATLHTFYPAVTSPWGLTTQDLSTPYDSIFNMLTATATADSHYAAGNTTELIYAADGTFEDYAFWKHGIWSLLFELGNSHTPSADDIADMIKTNVPGLRRMMEKAPTARAEKHDFTGKCDARLRRFDRHDE